MSKLGEKERKELRRRAFELHLQDDQLIAVGHVAIGSAMLDKLIDLTFQQIIRHYPETLKNELDKLSSPKRLRLHSSAARGRMRVSRAPRPRRVEEVVQSIRRRSPG